MVKLKHHTFGNTRRLAFVETFVYVVIQGHIKTKYICISPLRKYKLLMLTFVGNIL